MEGYLTTLYHLQLSLFVARERMIVFGEFEQSSTTKNFNQYIRFPYRDFIPVPPVYVVLTARPLRSIRSRSYETCYDDIFPSNNGEFLAVVMLPFRTNCSLIHAYLSGRFRNRWTVPDNTASVRRSNRRGNSTSYLTAIMNV
jgi:hypothetical protein